MSGSGTLSTTRGEDIFARLEPYLTTKCHDLSRDKVDDLDPVNQYQRDHDRESADPDDDEYNYGATAVI